MTRHRKDVLPRSYRPLLNGERRLWLRYFRSAYSPWYGAPDPAVVSDTLADSATLTANYFGETALIGPTLSIDEAWVAENIDRASLRWMQEAMEQRLADRLRKEGHVVDQGDDVVYTFSIQVSATARVKGWPDAAPGLTSIPWKPVRNWSVLWNLSLRPDEVQRVLIPDLVNAVHRAQREENCFRVAVLCEPLTAQFARSAGVAEYVTLVEDERQPRGLFRIAEEV